MQNNHNEWREVRLGDLVSTQYGYTTSATDKETGIKFLRITDIVPDFIDWDNVPFCEIEENDVNKYLVSENDILVARTGATVGYAKQIGKIAPKSIFASYLVRLRLKPNQQDKVSEKYLGVLVTSDLYKSHINTIAGGSAQPNANANDLISIRFQLPPLETQKQIASILASYDDEIEANLQRISILEASAQDLYKEWFVRFRVNSGIVNSEELIVNNETGSPEGWEVRKFNDFIKLNRGFDLPDDKIEEGTYPVIASTSIKAFHKEYKVKAPCVTTGRSGTLGVVLYVDADSWPLNTSLYVKDFKGNSPIFVYYLLQELHLETFNSGAGVPTLNQNHLHNLNIFVPNIELQKRFELIVNKNFSQIKILQEANQTLRQTRDRLLPRLMSGEVLVNSE